MVGLYKDPKGESIFSKVTGSGLQSSIQQSTKLGIENAGAKDLRKRVGDLEAELQAAKVRFSTNML